MKLFSIFLTLIISASFAPKVEAALHTETIEYRHGDKVLAGHLAYDDSIKGKRPGVIVVHEWWGLNDYIKGRAEQLARLGYIAFAINMYGKNMTAKTAEEAGRLAGIYRSDRKLMRARADAGLEVLRKHPLTEAGHIAAIGYCFGGGTVLELARSGAALSGVAVGERLYLSGLGGTVASTLNGLSHAISAISGGGSNVYTLTVATTGLAWTSGGSGYAYPQSTEALAWSGQFYVPVHFVSDEIDWELARSGPYDGRLVAGPNVSMMEVPE